MSNPFTFTLEDDGQEYTLKRFSEEHPVTYRTAYNTWLALNRPAVVTLAQMMSMQPAPRKGSSGRYTNHVEVVFPSGTVTVMDFRQLAKHCELISGHPVSPLAIYKRWTKMSRPGRVKIDDIARTRAQVMAAIRAMEIKTPAQESLGHIVKGDLEHLGNGPINTGAARVGCDEWSNRKTFKGGPAFSGFCSMGPCYQGKQ